mmetsp:Transcript_78082/g.155176  ORF Transcript_78082/g.155176 Transcript_78082/m.155176 type:complete len:219 (-) Transcript_78082:4-660(-)
MASRQLRSAAPQRQHPRCRAFVERLRVQDDDARAGPAHGRVDYFHHRLGDVRLLLPGFHARLGLPGFSMLDAGRTLLCSGPPHIRVCVPASLLWVAELDCHLHHPWDWRGRRLRVLRPVHAQGAHPRPAAAAAGGTQLRRQGNAHHIHDHVHLLCGQRHLRLPRGRLVWPLRGGARLLQLCCVHDLLASRPAAALHARVRALPPRSPIGGARKTWDGG